MSWTAEFAETITADVREMRAQRRRNLWLKRWPTWLGHLDRKIERAAMRGRDHVNVWLPAPLIQEAAAALRPRGFNVYRSSVGFCTTVSWVGE